jgi:acyl dehydratase
VLEKVDGVVTFEHHGFNQRGETVVTLRRRVRIASARA